MTNDQIDYLQHMLNERQQEIRTELDDVETHHLDIIDLTQELTIIHSIQSTIIKYIVDPKPK